SLPITAEVLSSTVVPSSAQPAVSIATASPRRKTPRVMNVLSSLMIRTPCLLKDARCAGSGPTCRPAETVGGASIEEASLILQNPGVQKEGQLRPPLPTQTDV